MKKVENSISIVNYSNYSKLTYIPSIIVDVKERIKILNAILKIKISDYDESINKYSVEFINNNGQDYLIDEFTLRDEQNIVHINITDELQQWINSNNNMIQIKIHGVSLSSDENEIVYDYKSISSISDDESYYNIDVKRAGSIELNLATGKFSLLHNDLECNVNALPITLNHHYNSINYNLLGNRVVLDDGDKVLPDYNMGKGWKTNFHQYLVKEKNVNLFSDKETSNKFTYIDGSGNEIIFEEKYYYFKDGAKVYTNLSDVTIDLDENLYVTIDDERYEIFREAQYENLTLTGYVEDFKGSEYIQKDIEEVATLKSNIKSINEALEEYNQNINYNNDALESLEITHEINGLSDLVRAKSLDSENRDIQAQYISREDQLASDLPPDDLDDEAQRAYYRAKNENLFAQWGKVIDHNNIPLVGDGTREGIMLNRKLSHIQNLQISELTQTYNSESYQTQKQKLESDNIKLQNKIDELNVLLVQKQYQLEQIEKQVPVYTISNDDGLVLGFGKTADSGIFRLIFIVDSYNNALYVNYTNDNIESIEDSSGRVITFKYNSDNVVSRIVDFNSKFIDFKYKPDMNGKKVLLSQIVYQDGAISNYIYDTNEKMTCILDSSGYGYDLEYSNCKVTKIKEISNVNKISDDGVEPIIEGTVTIDSKFECNIKNIISIDYYDYKQTIVTNELTNKKISYLFDNKGNVVSSYENKFENGSIIGNVAVKSYDKSNDSRYFTIQNLPYSKNFLEGSFFTDNLTSSFVLGEDLLCGYELYLSSYRQDEGTGTNNNVFILNENNSCISKFVNNEYINEINETKISNLILSGWAKADSAWVDRRCTKYNSSTTSCENGDELYFKNLILLDNDNYRKNRRFELRAIVTYDRQISENDVDEVVDEQYCSFDWMSTEWQYCAFPLTINKDPSYVLKSIKVLFDYSNNVGSAQFCNMELRKGLWEYYECDDKGRLTYCENGETGDKTTYEYEEGKLLKETITTSKENIVNMFYYNNKGALIRKVSSEGVVIENEYNDKGILIKSYSFHLDNPNAKMYTKNLILDDYGNVTSEFDSYDIRHEEYRYKANTNLITQTTNGLGNAITFGYSLDDRFITSISSNVEGDNNYNIRSYQKDLLTKLCHNDCKFNFVYDGYGNIIETQINDELLFSTTREDIKELKLQENGEYKFLVVGEKIIKKLATQETFVIFKNLKGTIYRVGYYENDEAEEEVLLENQVDNVGSVVISKDYVCNINYKFDYNEKGNINNVEYNQDGKTIIIKTLDEDEDKIVKQMSINGQLKEEEYFFDKKEQLSKVRLSNGYYSSQELDKLDRVKKINLSSLEKNFEYLQNGDISTNLVSNEWYCTKKEDETLRLENFHYVYDKTGKIIKIIENGNTKVKYEYDNLSRLVREDNFDFNETVIYKYDIGGNIINKRKLQLTNERTEDIDGGICLEYLYNGDGWKDQLLSYNGKKFKYDSMGNPIIYKDDILEWDKGTLLVSYEDKVNNSIYKYNYNYRGIRTSKTVNGQKINYYLDGDRIIAQDDGNLLYFHYGMDGIVGFTYDGVGSYFYKKNIQGDIIGIYDESGVQFAKYEYDAWGNHLIKVLVDGIYININEINGLSEEINNYIIIAQLNPFRYRGYYFDSETKLYYCNFRYYSPELGRWISADSIEYLDFNNINGLNLYCYCLNNPIMLYDESGHSWKSFWKKAKKWVSDHAKELAIGTAFIVVGALVTAFTAGAGVGFMAALGNALLSSAIQVGISVAVGVGVNGIVNVANGNAFFDNVGDVVASSYMWGGIFAGSAQIVGGAFRVAANNGVTTGRSGGIKLGNSKIKIFSPDKNNWPKAGGTLIKFGNAVRIDAGAMWGLHLHVANSARHLPIGLVLAGLLGL